LSRPDADDDAAKRFATSPLLPRDKEGLVFAEPWEAQAFAMAVKLSEEGHFTWMEWTIALGEQLQAVLRSGEADDRSRYFEHWIAALEHLVVDKNLTDLTALSERKKAWADSYRHTPHGHPVELGARGQFSGL